jgi:adenylate kinase
MAPIKDDTVETLRDLVHKLEARVADLEARITGDGSRKARAPQESIRMILMGPPGAGEMHQISQKENKIR